MWKYEFSKETEKALVKFPDKLRNLILKRIKNIGDWFEGKNELRADVKKLLGEWEGFYRLRVGKIRVLFSIDEDSEIIRIHDIGHRGDIYK